ncbi:hypothetical protein CHS0354_041906 [Potamilus streckersoni]|uniref:RING-type domain-containing protein n=1 Tax=Potamilus streckersoni TaxID=2493646 RepID=A0AAE0SST1_9BIVA|nr:hypothetical protein CHS0354_041906 [Potamilus streckersoni]
MASENIAEQIKDNFFSCTICYQPYNRPKALPCLHTFCEVCLSDYIHSRFEGSHVFPCPMCRQDINLPASGVAGFIDNYMVEKLSGTISSAHFQGHADAHSSVHASTERTRLLQDHKSQDLSEVKKYARLFQRFGSFGMEAHQFVHISGLSKSIYSDEIVIADCSLNKISVFSLNGQFRTSFICDCSIRDVEVTPEGTILTTVSRAGSALLREYSIDGRLVASHGSFYKYENPFGIVITRTGVCIVTSLQKNCVHVLTNKKKHSITFGSRGCGPNHFNSPYYVTTNMRDDIIVSDTGNNRIKVHRSDGTFVQSFGNQGSSDGKLFYPMGVCTDKNCNIYVADANNYRVQMFSPEGSYIASPVIKTYEYGIDVKPVHVAFIHDDILIVALRGTRFSEIHAYLWDCNKFKPKEDNSCLNCLPCCSSTAYDDI